MSVHRPPARLGISSSAVFLAVYVAVLALVGTTGALRLQIDPLDYLCPVMLLLAGVLLGRVTLAVAVALSLADLVVVHTMGHHPLTETLLFAALFSIAACCGWALRRWWVATSAPTVTEAPREVEVTASGHAQTGFGGSSTIPPEAAVNPDLALLSRRERDVAMLAVEGLNSREIGRQLFISERTVETHLSKVYDKLEIHSRRELIARLERGRAAPSTSPARARDGRAS